MGVSEIKLGLVGAAAGNSATVLEQLQHQVHLQLAEVYDPCMNEAKFESQQLGTEFSASLDGLLHRTEGVLFRDVKWMKTEPIVRAASLERPALVLSAVLATFTTTDLARLQRLSALTGTLIMPELCYRWSRSTLRLRELTATRLGEIQHMELRCQCLPGSYEELLILDWCGNVMQSECRGVRSTPDGARARLRFRRMATNGEPASIVLQLEAEPQPAEFPIVEARAECRSGKIRLTSDDSIEWEAAGRSASECLKSDRSAAAVMLDLFGRRIVQGIVPVPDMTDLLRAHEIRAALLASRNSDAEVPVRTV
jgi:hypothetical protein